MPLLRPALLLLCAMSWLRKSASSAATVADSSAPVVDSEAPGVKKLRRTLVRRTAIVQVQGPSVTVWFDRVTTLTVRRPGSEGMLRSTVPAAQYQNFVVA